MSATQPRRILIAEDEPKLAALLRDYLTASGFDASCVSDGLRVVPEFRRSNPDLVILDLMLPHRDGLEICRELRTFSTVPIVMVTARVEEIDRLLGLELGADDYVCKPFSPREVVARIKAILRRATRGPAAAGGLTIDADRHRAEFEGVALELTPVEFRLLSTLAAAPGRVFSRARLMENLYPDHRIVTDRTVDSHVKNLRRKLEKVSQAHEAIQSVYGLGYKLEL
ncbi:MAG: response regulator [Proteobacteria bacterium]|nr:response regulator [Pseudomonadota bacterium]